LGRLLLDWKFRHVSVLSFREEKKTSSSTAHNSLYTIYSMSVYAASRTTFSGGGGGPTVKLYDLKIEYQITEWSLVTAYY
jgi:hypothetical protein